MKHLYLFIGLIIVFLSAEAQKQNVYFLKNDGRLVDSKDSADYIRILREPDEGSKLYNVIEYFPKGQKKLLGKSSKIDPILLEGTCLTFYANGARERIATYKDGLIIGTEYTYFPNGQAYTVKEFSAPDSTVKGEVKPRQTVLIKSCNDSTGKALVTDGNGHFIAYRNGFKNIAEQGDVKDGKATGEWKGNDEAGKVTFTEKYENNELISGTATDSAGNYTYQKRYIYPRYKDGVEAFYRYLGQNVRYPQNDRRNNIQGTVILSFIVTKTGKVERVKLLRKVSPSIDEEAIRVVSSSKNWLPGAAYGRLVDGVFSVPISFWLSNQ